MSRTLTPTTFMLIFVSGTAMSRNQRKCTDPPKTDLDKRLHEAHQEAVKAMVHFVYCEGLTRIFMRVVFWIVKLSRLPFALKSWAIRTVENSLQIAYLIGSPNFAGSRYSWLA
jgi:hypothetical protein